MRVPTTLQRIRAARGAIGLAAPRAAAPSAREIAARVVRDLPSDTLLPGAFSRPDSLLPRATRATAAPAPATARPGRARPVGAPPTGPDEITTRRAGRRGVARVQFRVLRNGRRVLVVAIVAVALGVSAVSAWPVVFGGAKPAPASELQAARATDLLRTVVGGGRTLFAPHHSLAGLTPDVLSAHSYKVPVVEATTVARPGEVSMLVTGTGTLTLATPAGGQQCVFARDTPATSVTQFVTTSDSGGCRASAAPPQGWRSL